MAAPYGQGEYVTEPPKSDGVDITDIFHIVEGSDPDTNSKLDGDYPNVAIITPDLANQFGGMWAKEQLDLTRPFSTEIYLYLGRKYNNPGTVADGMTFTLHNDPGGINAIGGAGEGLGVYRGRKHIGTNPDGTPKTEENGTALLNSLVVEFDTFRNVIVPNSNSFVDDPPAPHCAILTPAGLDYIRQQNHMLPFDFVAVQDWLPFKANWTPDGSGGGTLYYSFVDPENPQNSKSYTINDVMSFFGSTKVWWGFTGATGMHTAVQAAAIIRLPEQGIIAEKSVKNEAGEDIDGGEVAPGESIYYTIRVTALELISPIGQISVDDTLSDDVVYVAESSMGATSSGSVFTVTPTLYGNAMTFTTGQLLEAEGDWLEVSFAVTVNKNAIGKTILNQAVVTADNLPDPQETNETKVTVYAEPEPPVKSVSDTSTAGQNDSEVKPGDEITYEITYFNHEDTEVEIVITDELDNRVDFVDATDGGTYDSGTHSVTWTLENIPIGERGVVSLTVRVNEDAVVKVENTATVQVGNNGPLVSNTVTNRVEPEDPEKSVSDDSEAGADGEAVKLGDEIIYEITYLNYEDAPAEIVITDVLDERLDFVDATNDGMYDSGTRTVTWTLANVPSGERGTVSLTVKVNETAVVKVENTATVQVGNNGPMISNTVTNRVEPEDPEKSVSDASAAGQNDSMVKVGDEITYEITYLNYEDATATIMITDVLDEWLDYVSATDEGTYDPVTRTVTWTLADVPSGERGTVSLTVKVNDKAVVRIENFASVTVGDNSPLITNTVENPVAPFKRVSESSAAGKDGGAVAPGDEITYEITYANHEDDPAEVVITDKLPDGVDFVSSSDGGEYDAGTHTVTWTLPDIESNTGGSVFVVVRVNESAVVKVENSATVTVGNNEPQVTNTVMNPIRPKKTVSESSEAGVSSSMVQPWDSITYVISYSNYSEEAATAVITDKLPAGVDFVSATDNGVYDKDTHTVTWTLPNVASGAEGTVSVVVLVNENAAIRIENSATVQVGENEPLVTNIVTNPVKRKGCLNQTAKCRKAITGHKIWVDDDNASDTRPPFVEIVLRRDGEVYQSVRVGSTGSGTFTFGCLPIWKNSEQKYNYRVDELTVPDGYTKTIDGNNITNTLTP